MTMSIFDVFDRISANSAAPKGKIEYVIAGLGNPGLEYDNTRHNAGFNVLDTLAKQFGTKFSKASLEKAMGIDYSFSDVTIKDYKPKEKKTPQVTKSNWEYFERNYFQKQNYLKSTIDDVKRDESAESISKKVEQSDTLTKNLIDLIYKALVFLFSKPKLRETNKKYKVTNKQKISLKDKPTVFGNINYHKLASSSGEKKLSLDGLCSLL